MFERKDSVWRAKRALRAVALVLALFGILLFLVGATVSGVAIGASGVAIALPTLL